MKGYVARKGSRWYAVIYEGLDPVTGKDRRRWHGAGTTREEAEELAVRLAAELNEPRILGCGLGDHPHRSLRCAGNHPRR